MPDREYIWNSFDRWDNLKVTDCSVKLHRKNTSIWKKRMDYAFDNKFNNLLLMILVGIFYTTDNQKIFAHMKFHQRIFYTLWDITGSSFCRPTDREQTCSPLRWNTSRGLIKTEIWALPSYHPLSVHKVSWSDLMYFLDYYSTKCFSILSNIDPTFDLWWKKMLCMNRTLLFKYIPSFMKISQVLFEL